MPEGAVARQVSVGRIVLYRLQAHEAAQLNAQREKGVRPEGNQLFEGQECPLLVVRVFNSENPEFQSVNGQVFLDSSDVIWVTSRQEGTAPGQWRWPV